MAKSARPATKRKTAAKAPKGDVHVCNLPPVEERVLPPEVNPLRAQLIRVSDRKWVNGTVLHYAFFKNPASWRGAEAQRRAVRQAFKAWKDLGIGLVFEEVADLADAEVRIGFKRGDGSWSYVGRDVIDVADDPAERTMNFGWDLTTPYGRDTALHEIGHTLGFPHEHQNPNAGIVWNEDEAYRVFGGPPNDWDRAKVHWNILRKLPPGSVGGSDWDPDSIMHYQLPAGVFDVPEEFRTKPLVPKAGLSARDITWVRKFYPPLDKKKEPELKAFESRRLLIGAGEQVNFRIKPKFSRKYTMQTFGKADTVMVLFEDTGGTPRYVDGDDDSAYSRNARIEARLDRSREYILRIRLYYAQRAGESAVFMW